VAKCSYRVRDGSVFSIATLFRALYTSHPLVSALASAGAMLFWFWNYRTNYRKAAFLAISR
jgi:hypothetical protein